MVIAYGLLGLKPGEVSSEDDNPTILNDRASNAQLTMELRSRGLRPSVMRLAPTVHGKGDVGFIPQLIQVARERGVSGYVGDGSQRWPAAHRLDAAELFLLAMESERGGVWHGAAEEGVTIRDVATLVSEKLGLPLVSVAPEEATVHFGWLGNLLAIDSPASSEKTRRELGWQPREPGLLEDMRQNYF